MGSHPCKARTSSFIHEAEKMTRENGAFPNQVQIIGILKPIVKKFTPEHQMAIAMNCLIIVGNEKHNFKKLQEENGGLSIAKTYEKELVKSGQ